MASGGEVPVLELWEVWSTPSLPLKTISLYTKPLKTTQKCKAQLTSLLGGGVIPPPNEYPGYDLKQSDGEAPVMLKLWGMQSTPSVPLLPGSLWPRVVAPDMIR